MEEEKHLLHELEVALRMKKISLSTAESCTGGGIAACITSVSGCSDYFKGGMVTYCNEAKINLLGVQPDTIEKYGVVSRQTVEEMAKGAMKAMKTDCAIATSGIAGPGGGTESLPVGTIWIAVAYKDEIITHRLSGDSGRVENVRNAIEKALKLLIELLK